MNVDSVHGESTFGGNPAGRNLRTVWTIPTEPSPFPHFAMFPQALVEPMIRAGCPERVCAACGTPWVRVTERPTPPDSVFTHTAVPDDKLVNRGFSKEGTKRGAGQKLQNWLNEHPTITLGFRAACSCDTVDTRPGLVLDMFMGAGTTGLVAQRLGRDYIGGDLNAGYVAIATDRLAYHGDDARMVSEAAAGVRQLALMDVA